MVSLGLLGTTRFGPMLQPRRPSSTASRTAGRCPDRKIFRKRYRGLRNKRPSESFEFLGLGAVDFTKPYEFIWPGDIHGPKPCKFRGFRWAFMSQTSVSRTCVQMLMDQIRFASMGFRWMLDIFRQCHPRLNRPAAQPQDGPHPEIDVSTWS